MEVIIWKSGQKVALGWIQAGGAVSQSAALCQVFSLALYVSVFQRNSETTTAEQHLAKSYGTNAKHGKHINSALDH